RDWAAPHAALAGFDRPVRDPAAVGIVLVASTEARRAQPIYRADDAHDVGPKPAGVRIDLVADGRNVLAQHAATGVVRVRSRQQSKQHLVVFAELLEQADGLVVAVRIPLAVAFQKPRLAHLYTHGVVRRREGRPARAVLQPVAGNRPL